MNDKLDGNFSQAYKNCMFSREDQKLQKKKTCKYKREMQKLIWNV